MIFLYDEKYHHLIKVLPDDIRNHIGTQKMMQSAPIGLIYVSDFSKFKSQLFKDDEQKLITSSADTGFISQNVYLYCAATNLNTAILGLVDREKLHRIIGLKGCEKIIYTQALESLYYNIYSTIICLPQANTPILLFNSAVKKDDP